MSKYIPFKHKVVVVKTNNENVFESAFFETKKHNNRFPKFFDSEAEALLRLCDHVKEIASDVHLQLKLPDELVYPWAFSLAYADLDATGLLYIYREPNGEYFEDEVLYDDNIIHLIK